MSDQPLLFLDIDGVLNCIEGDHPEVEIEGEEFPVQVPVGTRERVQRLLDIFEPTWATAWRGSAHRCWRSILALDPLPWPYVDYRDLKLPEIIKAAKGRPFVWIDDDAEWELRELGWDRSMVDGLIIAPDPKVGLTDEHVEEILGWVAICEGVFV